MTIVFFWNYLNNHQVWIADEMYKLLGNDFTFVTTMPLSSHELKGGVDYSNRPYCLMASSSDENYRKAVQLAQNATVCVFGACSQEYAVIRAKENPTGLSFECGERWLKKGLINALSPNCLKWWLNYQRYYRKANFYKLCSSAYAKHDDELMGCYKGKHFKWGYFTRLVSHTIDKNFTGTIRIMWCARFIPLKHPEFPLQLAKVLKANGYQFVINMYGDGDLKDEMFRLTQRMHLDDVVIFHGNLPNTEILKAMSYHDIFLFTSNRLEGWGAVLNESMSNGCCPVASNSIGSTPYLITDHVNGLVYNESQFESLFEKVKFLLDNPEECQLMGKNAAITLRETWNPANAATQLLHLISTLLTGEKPDIDNGPCSLA